MALSKAPVSRQAPGSSAAAPKRRAVYAGPPGVEDFTLEEDEEPTPVSAVTPEIPVEPRLIVNGVVCSRIQVTFAKDQTCLVPGGSVVERFWDLYDPEENARYNRPQLLKYATVNIQTREGYLDIAIAYPNCPGLVRLPVNNACLYYEPKT